MTISMYMLSTLKLRHSTGKFLQIFRVSLVVILRQTMAHYSILCREYPYYALLTFMECSTTFCCRLEASSDVVPGIFARQVVPDNAVKLRDPRLNRYREICQAAFPRFFCDNFRPEVASDVFFPVWL